MIGLHVTDEALSEAIDEIDRLDADDRPDVIVLEIDAGGGFVAAVPALAEGIAHDLGDRAAVVVRVRRAISAAALVALAGETIVFDPAGVMGGASASQRIGGADVQTTARDEHAARLIGAKCAVLGGHDAMIARAMQTTLGLARRTVSAGDRYLIPASGREPSAHTEILHPAGEVLTLNAHDAEALGLSSGVASDAHAAALLALERAESTPTREVGQQPAAALERAHRLAQKHLETIESLHNESQAVLVAAETPDLDDAAKVAIERDGLEVLERLETMVKRHARAALQLGLDEDAVVSMRVRLRQLSRAAPSTPTAPASR